MLLLWVVVCAWFKVCGLSFVARGCLLFVVGWLMVVGCCLLLVVVLCCVVVVLASAVKLLLSLLLFVLLRLMSLSVWGDRTRPQHCME